jgi:Domain of unknown function (DUF4062)
MKTDSIFISSTWEDLKEHRAMVIESLQKLQARVHCMEYFGASPKTAKEKSIERVRSSDIFIGILGTRYGSIDKETGKSITELEYMEARKSNKPTLMYLIDREKHPVLPKFVDTDNAALSLSEFIEKVSNEHLIQRFTSPENLSRQVVIDLVNLLEERNEILLWAPAVEGNVQDMSKTFPKSNKYKYSLERISPLIDSFSSLDDSFLSPENKTFQEGLEGILMAQELANGNFEILDDIISFEPIVEDVLVSIFQESETFKDSLANEILLCPHTFRLRLLIILGGRLKADQCAENICRVLLHGRRHQLETATTQLQITPFNDIAKRALISMSPSTNKVLEKYVQKAKKMERWQAKQIFESVLRSKKVKHSIT